jgi:hypothetical protein
VEPSCGHHEILTKEGKRRTLGKKLCILGVFCCVLILPAMAAENGRIACVSDHFGREEIFVMNADGSGQTNLTPDQAVGRSPPWSPDATKILFLSDRDDNRRS